MRKQDLFKLAIGTYNLKDDIYKYTLEVNISEDGVRCYVINEVGFFNHIVLIEGYENETGGCSFYPGDIKYKVLSAIMRMGGLFIHSSDTYDMLSGLELIPRGSFAKFIENTK